MKLTLALSLLILSQVAVAQRDAKGLMPPPPYIPDEEDRVEEIEKIGSKVIKADTKSPELPQNLPKKAVIGQEYKFDVPQYQVRDSKSKWGLEQAETLAGCALSYDAQEIVCPFGNFKKDPGTDNSSSRQNTKTDLPSAAPKKPKKSGSKATAQ